MSLKKILATLLTAALLLSLAACGGKQDSQPQDTPPADSGTSAPANTDSGNGKIKVGFSLSLIHI